MAEETEKATENKPTDERSQQQFWKQLNEMEGFYKEHRSMIAHIQQTAQQHYTIRNLMQHMSQWNRLQDQLKSSLNYFISSSSQRYLELAANTNDLALSVGGEIGDTNVEELGRAIGVDDAVMKLLINSALADVERIRENMDRDEEEIQRLKQKTRAVLDKLAA